MHIILNITAHTAHKTCLQAAVSLLWQKQTCIFTAIKTDCSSASIGFSNVRCVNFRLQSLLQITIKKHQSMYNHVHTACFGWDKKLTYRRETARQLPTWRGLSLPVHSSSPLWPHLCVYGRIRNPQQMYVKLAVRKAHFKLNRAFKVIQGYPYLCRQEPRAVYCRNV